MDCFRDTFTQGIPWALINFFVSQVVFVFSDGFSDMLQARQLYM